MWDYRVEWWHKGRDVDGSGLAAELSKLGSQGWELVTMQKDDTRISSGAFMMVMKRPQTAVVHGRGRVDIDDIDFVDLRETS
jgi:hypothetical protein